MVGGNVEIGIIDRLLHRGIVVEHQGFAGMPEQARLAGAWLDDAAIGSQIALEHSKRTLGINGIFHGADDVVIIHLRACDIFPERVARNRHAIEMQVASDAAHQPRQATGVVKILHQKFFATRPHIGDHRHPAAGLFEIVEPNVLAGAARLRDQVNDRIGGAAHRHRNGDRVLKGLAALDPPRRQILPDHLDNAAATFGSHADVTGIRRRNRRRARKRHADGFGDRGHGRCRAHGHAGAVAAGDASLDIDPVLVGNLAGAPLVPVFPGIRPRSQRLALPVAAQHRTRGQKNRRQIHARRTKQQRRRGLVASAHQHHAIDRMAAQQLLRIHRQQVAIEHGCRLQQRLR